MNHVAPMFSMCGEDLVVRGGRAAALGNEDLLMVAQLQASRHGAVISLRQEGVRRELVVRGLLPEFSRLVCEGQSIEEERT